MSVAVIEKESRTGEGISSRNSGVIHAGMYYPKSSLKTKFCISGNKLLYEYAKDKNINHKKTLKLEGFFTLKSNVFNYSPKNVDSPTLKKTLTEIDDDTGVEKEIIEYDAILYEFIKIGTKSETSPGIPEWKWVTSEADIQKYQGLAMPNSFKPTGVYRIKSRNVFEVVKPTDTESLTHKVKLDSLTAEWKAREWTHKAGTFGAEKPSLFTLDQKI